LNPKTVAKWRKRTTTADAPMGPKTPKSTVLTPAEEAIVVAFRHKTLLPLDDVLGCLRDTIPNLSRSAVRGGDERTGELFQLQGFYSIRSERLLMERLGIRPSVPLVRGIGVWDRWPEGGGRNAEADFHGQKRSNETHASTTDPDARLYRKGQGKETKLCFMGHGLMENRHGLLVDACLTAERVAALHIIEPRAEQPPITLGADKAYDAEDFVNELRSMRVTPHVARHTSGRRSAIDGRTTRHGGYAVSQRIRKRMEEAFGWIKSVAGQDKTRFRGRDRVGWAFTFAAAACNLVRLPKLIAVPT
jgi:hypothetical protein